MSRRLKIDAIKRIATGKSTPAQEFPKVPGDKPCKVIMQVSDETNTQLLYQDEDKILTVDEVERLRADYSLLICQIMTIANKHLFEPHFHIARTGALQPPTWVNR